MMRVNSSVFSRGVILVAIPILFQFVFVAWLAFVLADAQQKLQAQWRSEELIRLACQLSRDTTDVIVYMQMPLDVKRLLGDDVKNTGLSRPRRDYDQLYALAHQNPKHADALEHLERYGKTLFNMQMREMEAAEQHERRLRRKEDLTEKLARREERKARRREELIAEGREIPEHLLPSKVPPAHTKFSIQHGRRRGTLRRSDPEPSVYMPQTDNYKVLLNEFGPKFYDSIGELVHSEELSMADTNAFGANSISAINQTLLIIVVAGIAVTILLGYIYSISIRKPLKHLGENGKRLSSRQPLLPVLAGEDEFARLDRLLHVNSQEVELALSRERAVMENAADLICVIDADGNFLVINPFVERMLGYLAEELLERPINSIAAPEQSLLADEYLRNAVAGAEQLFELKLKKRNGEFIETRWSCIWSDEDKKLFCVVHDISEEKAIEQLKQDFADMISHDLRSPLMAMSNSLTLIEAGAKGEISQEAKASVEASAKNVEKLIALVNDLLDFQKLKAGKMQLNLERVSLPSVVREAADLLIESAEHKSVGLVLPEGELMIECDHNKILQTVVNLLSNAIKFSEKGSKVTVAIKQSEGNVSLCVSDTGPGVPEEFRTKIFEPFEQAPSARAKEGTGLGLAICKLVVEAHGGRISVQSNRHDDALQPGSGSVFVIDLPINGKPNVADE